MKTSDDNPNSLLTNLPHSQEEQPRPTEDQAAASTRGNHQGRPPAKRRRIEPDEPGTSTRRGQPFSVNARIVASEGARDSHVRQHAVTRSRRRRGTAPERRPDRMPADGSVSSSHRGPQRPTYGLGAADLRLTERQSDRTAGKRPREEPYRQRKRPRHRLELAEYLRQAERQLLQSAARSIGCGAQLIRTVSSWRFSYKAAEMQRLPIAQALEGSGTVAACDDHRQAAVLRRSKARDHAGCRASLPQMVE